MSSKISCLLKTARSRIVTKGSPNSSPNTSRISSGGQANILPNSLCTLKHWSRNCFSHIYQQRDVGRSQIKPLFSQRKMACSHIHVEVTMPIQETGESINKKILFTIYPIESESILQTTSCNIQIRRSSRATRPASAFLTLTPTHTHCPSCQCRPKIQIFR
jgi:hypothetical protein